MVSDSDKKQQQQKLKGPKVVTNHVLDESYSSETTFRV